MQDKNVIKLTDQDAALLEQGASMLEGLENDERNRGNYSTAEGAGCSAHAVRRLASALLAHEREIGQCLHQIQEPAAAEQAAWHAGLDEGRAQAAPAAVAVPDEREAIGSGDANTPAPKIFQPAGWQGNGQPPLYTAEQIAALAATPAAAAPVVLPEPAAVISEVMGLVEKASVQRASMAVLIYTEQPKELSDKAAVQERDTVKLIETKLRALLAGVSAPAAQAVEPTDAELIALNAGECYFGESPSKYPELGHGTQYHAGAPGVLGFARAALALRSDPAAYSQKFQLRVQPWMMACFGPEISANRIERNHRFLEESLELVQSLGCTASEAHQLVDYVFGRPVGDPMQEAGGVMVTLAALCLAGGLDMHACGETELARIWTKVEAIRAKQAAKPKHSPLPMHAPQALTDSALLDAMEKQRIAVVPEYEGPWDAEVYNGDEKPNHRGSGSTPREAIRAAIAAQAAQQGGDKQ